MHGRIAVVLALGLVVLALSSASRARPQALSLGAWLPHWKKEAGAARALERLSRFDQLSPFAFRVGESGEPQDTPRIARPPWPTLLARARAAGVAIIPTVVWSHAKARATVLRDREARDRHIEALLELARAHDFDGLDLDYERKRKDEGEGFSALVRELSRRLHASGKQLSCTIEPRTSDAPQAGVPASRRSPWRDDYAVLGAHCDQVRVMAYDQHAIEARPRSEPAHSALDWVRAIVTYTRSRIPPRKLHLGVPTYGWALREQRGRYRRERAVSFPELRRLLARGSFEVSRSAGGELLARRGARVIVMSDAQAIAARIALARQHGLAGVMLFKLDGDEDPLLWQVL